MKLQWFEGGMRIRPSNRGEYHRLLWLFRELGGMDENGDLKDLYITTEKPADLNEELGYECKRKA